MFQTIRMYSHQGFLCISARSLIQSGSSKAIPFTPLEAAALELIEDTASEGVPGGLETEQTKVTEVQGELVTYVYILLPYLPLF